MPGDNLSKLNTYFEKYIDKMLIEDIEKLEERNEELKFSYPYLLLACSCIDLFGAIEKGFKSPTGQSNSRDRFTWFIIEWMGRTNDLYRDNNLAYLIYDSWRCGVVHQATLKKGFETSSFMYPREKHLNYIEDNERVFIHSLQFADDLIAAQKMYRKYINDNAGNTSYVESLYNHLLDMIKDETKEYFEDFIKLLQGKRLVFNSTESFDAKSLSPRTSRAASSVSSSQSTITQLSDPDDDIYTTVSAAPDENDLK